MISSKTALLYPVSYLVNTHTEEKVEFPSDTALFIDVDIDDAHELQSEQIRMIKKLLPLVLKKFKLMKMAGNHRNNIELIFDRLEAHLDLVLAQRRAATLCLKSIKDHKATLSNTSDKQEIAFMEKTRSKAKRLLKNASKIETFLTSFISKQVDQL